MIDEAVWAAAFHRAYERAYNPLTGTHFAPQEEAVMTTSITISCDAEIEWHSTCARRAQFGTDDPAAARRIATQAGWVLDANGDRCPFCSGKRRRRR